MVCPFSNLLDMVSSHTHIGPSGCQFFSITNNPGRQAQGAPMAQVSPDRSDRCFGGSPQTDQDSKGCFSAIYFQQQDNQVIKQ